MARIWRVRFPRETLVQAFQPPDQSLVVFATRRPHRRMAEFPPKPVPGKTDRPSYRSRHRKSRHRK